MIFYLHFILLTSGLSGTSVLLGVFLKAYSDASQGEIGILLMTFPFLFLIIKPLFCSMADRHQAHRGYLIVSLVILIIGIAPFVGIPYFPELYVQNPRISWYLLVLACYVSQSALAVAWSLGESLAVNSAQKTKTPYGRLRLCGTVSWGVYGYIIGQINECPYFPKFVPAFLILIVSVVIEITLLMLWNKEHFVMEDAQQVIMEEPEEKPQYIEPPPLNSATASKVAVSLEARHLSNLMDSTPSSVGGSLRLAPKTAVALRDIILSEDLGSKLKNLERDYEKQQEELEKGATVIPMSCEKLGFALNAAGEIVKVEEFKAPARDCESNIIAPTDEKKKNPQILIFKMIMAEDGRLIKYLILFAVGGYLLAPMNFVFLSLDEVCKDKGCNFSNLAGSVLISQAVSETLCFLFLPYILAKIKRSAALLFALTLLAIRYFFYANYYYTSDISPYWALLGEWGHGIGFGIFATILADVALMFASQCKLFIPELRRLGLLSPVECGDKEKIQTEENAVRMALRATMQAVFSGFMEGLGQGVGSLVCGIVVEMYSYIKLWQLMMFTAIGAGVLLQLVEVTKTKWSDSFKPVKGTKAYEIRSLETSHKKPKSNGVHA